MKKIAVITSGGDAPGMNAALRAITKAGIYNSLQVIGFEDGFQGIIENRFVELTYSSVNNISILQSSNLIPMGYQNNQPN